VLKKKPQDHNVLYSSYSREMREILNASEYSEMGLAVGVDLFPMDAHYHKTFDEIFYVLDGKLDFKFYDPVKNGTWTEELSDGDTLVVSKGVHHKVIKSSPENRLLVISIPPYHPDDEIPSDVI